MSVFISNLDDFITPGQACVNPIALGRANEGKKEQSGDSGSVKILETQTLEYEASLEPEPILRGEANLIKNKVGSLEKVATISLNDCLACSGCVTSAETVLIQQQSSDKLFSKLREIESGSCSETVIVAMSPQSRASLASQLGMSSKDTFLRVATLLKRIGVTYVVDVASAADISLIEAREEFMMRHRNAAAGTGATSVWETPQKSIAHSSTKVIQLPEGMSAAAAVDLPPIYVGAPSVPLTKPMIVSSCPGWVCYAEKTQPQSIPYLSSVKSSQQILGHVIKNHIHEKSRRGVFLVSIQPCFDKKLEASRLDFHHEGESGHDEVDLVLSTIELYEVLKQLASEAGVTGDDETATAAYVSDVPLDLPQGSDATESMFRCFSEDGARLAMAVEKNRGSGGYLEYIFRYASGQDPKEELVYETGRNADIATVTDPTTGLRFAKVYGFRNIQSLILKLKRQKCDYDFVEVMACPSGCLNGGGQIRPLREGVEAPEAIKRRVGATEASLHGVQGEMMIRNPDDSPLARYLFSNGVLGSPGSDAAREALHTRFHAVPKLEELAPLASKW